MAILYYIVLGLCIFCIFFLVFPFIKVFFSLFAKEKLKTEKELGPFKNTDFGCIITAYRNAEIAKPLIESLLRQKHDNLMIYLVADNCDVSEWDVEHEKLVLFRPEPALNLKAKSIIHAIENFRRDHEYCVVFDADNLAHPEFLNEINKYVNNGHRAIQGQRTAKNLDTTYACMDAMGEFYKNYVERYVPYLLGSSSVISGSGMAVETELYKSYLYGEEITKGKEKWKKMLQEDKILQNDLMKMNERITYAWDAVVYDEKVTTGEQVETQRSRWLFSYFQNLPNSTGIFMKGLFTFNYNKLMFGMITMAPPLFILLFFSIFMMFVSAFVSWPLAIAMFCSLGIFSLTILWTLHLSKVPKQVWSAIWSMPLFIWNQLRGLVKMGNPNKNFKHSEHTRNYSIDEVIKNSPQETGVNK